MSVANSSGFKGVYKRGKRFRSQIKLDSKIHYLGTFDTPEEAHEAFCEAVRSNFSQAIYEQVKLGPRRVKHKRNRVDLKTDDTNEVVLNALKLQRAVKEMLYLEFGETGSEKVLDCIQLVFELLKAD